MSDTVQPVPAGMHTLTAYLIIKDTPAAIAFYEKAFNAKEIMRIPGPDGRLMHASMQFGDSVLMMSEEYPEFNSRGPLDLGGSPVGIHMYVNDVNAAWQQAVEAGCEVIMPLDDTFWGDRFGCLVDPFGHRWSLAQQIRLVTAEEMQQAALSMTEMCGPQE